MPRKIKTGRKTEYCPHYCKSIIDYFQVDHTKIINETYTNKQGQSYSKPKEIANSLPLLEGFAVLIGVDVSTIRAWSKKYADFKRCYARARSIQYDMLVNNGLRGLYNANFCALAVKNLTDWTDRKETQVVGAVEHKHFLEQVINKAQEIKLRDTRSEIKRNLVIGDD